MNWNTRYAVETQKSFEQAWGGTPPSAEEALNRLIPTTSYPIQLTSDKISGQLHELDRPVGNLKSIITFVDPTGMKLLSPADAYLRGDPSSPLNESYEWGDYDNANKALKKHFEEKPIDLPNKIDLEHPDNHLHVLHRVKSWVATQV